MYINNRCKSRTTSERIGTTEIRLGNDSAAYNIVNSVIWAALYDGGFFPIGTNYNGQYLTIRRVHKPLSDNWYTLNEVRVYQVPNLLQELSTVAITPDTSASTASDTSATNLITNLGNRASNDSFPIKDVNSVLATDYKTCFKVTDAEISSGGNLFKFGVDL